MKGRIKRLEKQTASRVDNTGYEIWGSREYMVYAVVKVYDLDDEVYIDIRDEILEYYDVDKVYSNIFDSAWKSLVGCKVDVEEDFDGDYYIVDLESYFD